MSDTLTMNIKDAIFCMKSYLPDESVDCTDCPYYGCVTVDNQVSVCLSSQAHKLAIVALNKELPKQLVYNGFEIRCPTCQKIISDSLVRNYCSYCGQLLDKYF